MDEHAKRMRRLNSAAVLLKYTTAGVMEADRLAGLLTDEQHAELAQIGQAGVQLPRVSARVQQIRLAARLGNESDGRPTRSKPEKRARPMLRSMFWFVGDKLVVRRKRRRQRRPSTTKAQRKMRRRLRLDPDAIASIDTSSPTYQALVRKGYA